MPCQLLVQLLLLLLAQLLLLLAQPLLLLLLLLTMRSSCLRCTAAAVNSFTSLPIIKSRSIFLPHTNLQQQQNHTDMIAVAVEHTCVSKSTRGCWC
jgi:hypothetical protein